MDTMTNLFKSARRVSTPLIAVMSPDPAASVKLLQSVLPEKTPIILWNAVEGLQGVNPVGEAALNQTIEKDDLEQSFDPSFALQKARNLPNGTVLFFQWGHKFMDDPRVIQSIWNLRDPFKGTKRTFVLLAPDFLPPIELSGDMVLIEEALPNDEQLGQILDTQYECVKDLAPPDATTRRKCVEALRGLPAFAAEQAIALSMTPEGVNLGQLWDMKRASIRNVRGLTMYEDRFTYQDLGGLSEIKKFHSEIFNGAEPPSVVVHIDEIEKALAGLGQNGSGDSSGTTQDQLGVLLEAMESNEWDGIILVGAPGTGKTAVATTTGASFNAPTLKVDLGAAKGSLVGQSEAQIRAAMRTIKGIAGKGAWFIATCNKLDILPPELRRRFNFGVWYVDLPTPEELKTIWELNIKRYELDPNQELPEIPSGYTGADVRNMCKLAYKRRCSLMEAATSIVPVSISDPDSIKRLRELADGKFLDASRPGAYSVKRREAVTGRGYNFDE